MIPTYIQELVDQLSEEQKSKFYALVQWSSRSGMNGISLPVHTYESIYQMVKQMGAEPINPIEPDRTVNHDWHIGTIKRENS